MRGGVHAQAPEHLHGRPFDGLAADQRGDGDAEGGALGEGRLHPREREDRPDADDRIARRHDEQPGGPHGVERLRRRAGAIEALELDGGDRIARTPEDEVLLKRQPARGRADDRGHPVVAHREDHRDDSERLAQAVGDLGEPSAFAQPDRARDVRRQVAVAQPEPRRDAVPVQHLQGGPRIPFDPPAPLAARQTGERVQHRVDVGGDVQAEMLPVVGRVDDHGERRRVGQHRRDPGDELRPSHTATEHREHAREV